MQVEHLDPDVAEVQELIQASDDYYVDLVFRNDHQLLFELEIEDKRLARVRMHPIFIEHCRTIKSKARMI